MVTIKDLVRRNIQYLKPYSSARDEFEGSEGVFLDANENPFGHLNRYPDPQQSALKTLLARQKQLDTDQIFIGNGSDEVIDLAFRIFCHPAVDRVIVCPPTYGMYEVSAHIHDVETVRIPLKPDFQLNLPAILATPAKMLFLCSPNNPTGNSLRGIDELLDHFQGIVVLDEAYIDFSAQASFVTKLGQYPHLIVSQTFSKAWGLAAARVGVAYAHRDIIHYFNQTKPPYNVSRLNQQAALTALQDQAGFEQRVATILAERERLRILLEGLPLVQRIYPSDANFLLLEVPDADRIYQQLVQQKIIVRNRNSVVKNTLRVTVGTPAENDALRAALEKCKL
jgi:histidinol-phosphate aminotransferase